jgi:hypothetical protein
MNEFVSRFASVRAVLATIVCATICVIAAVLAWRNDPRQWEAFTVLAGMFSTLVTAHVMAPGQNKPPEGK